MDVSEAWHEGWMAHAMGWPLYDGHTKPYRLGWLARQAAVSTEHMTEEAGVTEPEKTIACDACGSPAVRHCFSGSGEAAGKMKFACDRHVWVVRDAAEKEGMIPPLAIIKEMGRRA